MNSDVIKFNAVSIEPITSYRSRSQEFSGFVVTFEISLTAYNGIDIEAKLGEIFSGIEHFEVSSISILDQNSFTEEGEY